MPPEIEMEDWSWLHEEPMESSNDEDDYYEEVDESEES